MLDPRLLKASAALVPLVAFLASAGGAGPADAATFVSVKGVAPGHVAWIYRSPDVATARVGYLKPNARRVRSLHCRRLSSGGWCQVMHAGTRGWVQDRFLARGAVMRG